MPAFLLDPRVLDDCVSDSAPDVEIVAVGLGCSRGVELPEYFFFQDRKLFLPDDLVNIHHTFELTNLGSRKFHYQRATVYLAPAADWWKSIPQSRLGTFRCLYAGGKFLKGDVGKLKNYGVKIKSF